MKKERNTKIDILRAIAMICIIFAHTDPHPLLFKIRNFDVIMIVILLGASYQLSMQDKKLKYFPYVVKRFKRLIVPTWIFLTIFFSIFMILSIITKREYFTLPVILDSYALLVGIGYVWIMRVFFIVALISPLILRLSNKIKSDLFYFLSLVALYTFYHLMYIQLDNISEPFNKLYKLVILEGFGYSIIAAIGIRLLRLKENSYIILLISSIILFVFLSIMYHFEPIQHFKYPPHIYYMSYGIMITLCLYKLLSIKVLHDKLNNVVLIFIAKHSLWLYFWHILTIYILHIFKPYLIYSNANFFTRFIFIFGLALLLTIIHNKIAKKIKHS